MIVPLFVACYLIKYVPFGPTVLFLISHQDQHSNTATGFPIETLTCTGYSNTEARGKTLLTEQSLQSRGFKYIFGHQHRMDVHIISNEMFIFTEKWLLCERLFIQRAFVDPK